MCSNSEVPFLRPTTTTIAYFRNVNFVRVSSIVVVYFYNVYMIKV